jgi:beta-1,2-mannobiose phosphorylase / 1,2-beta-oligomannan phosphorylase
LICVAERPKQTEGYVSVAQLNDEGDLEVLKFGNTDPHLDLSDPNLVYYKGTTYLRTISHLMIMCSDDGREFYVPENYGFVFGEGELEAYGIADCRVTEINEIFYLTYTMTSSRGSGIGLMQTRDWKRFERKGMILSPHNKACAIFEEKIRNKYYALHSPCSTERGGDFLWLTESPDGIHWGKHKCIATTRQGMWDSARLEVVCSPIQTPQGWLAIYHGVDEHLRCCLGALLLDINDPSVVIARSESPFIEPSKSYEFDGPRANTLMSSGHLVVADKLTLYYCTGNGVICGAELSVHDVIASLISVK